MRDFTLDMYRRLLEAVKDGGYDTPLMKDYIAGRLWKTGGKHCVFRHDIDRKTGNAVKMAELEGDMGIRATYYVRYVPEVYNVTLLKEIESTGHEIGFHYETLDKANGDTERAYELFKVELAEIQKDFDIKTICMHGRPFNPWRNLDIWQKYDYRKLGLVGEPYLDVDYSRVAYFTDTGRSWAARSRVKDHIPEDNYNNRHDLNPRSTQDLIDIIRTGKHNNIIILAHPNRWTDSLVEWLWELIWQNTKNAGKIFLKKRVQHE